ncbi:MAG: Gfo/Idh/MocA family oxidoreductase [Pikeienuella sp.]
MFDPVLKRPRRQRILLVGSGRRVQNNYLPALTCLRDEFEIVGIHSRTEARLRPVADHWGVPAVLSLEDVDFSKVDVVSVSVPTAQNANVLKQLAGHEQNLHLVIDTPIVQTQAQYQQIAPLLALFKSVTVTEDYMNFPSFDLVRKAVRDGVIGEVRGLVLNHIGFRYHGLALIRSFVDFEPVKASRVHKLGNGPHSVVSYFFASNLRASVVGPYRKHLPGSGGLVVEGTNGGISEFEADGKLRTLGKPTLVLRPITEGGNMIGYEIAGRNALYRQEFADVIAMREMDFPDKSDMNLLRGQGLAEVFRSVASHWNINQAYGYKNAFYDAFACRLAAEGAKNLDPLNIFAGEPGNWHKEFAAR